MTKTQMTAEEIKIKAAEALKAQRTQNAILAKIQQKRQAKDGQ